MTRNSNVLRTSWMRICSSLHRDSSLSVTMTVSLAALRRQQANNQGGPQIYWTMGYFLKFCLGYEEQHTTEEEKDAKKSGIHRAAAAEDDPCRERSLEDQVRVLPWQKPAVSKQQFMTQNLSGGGVEQTQGLCLVCPKWKDIAGGWGRGNLRRKRADSDQRPWRPETSLMITVLILKTSLIKYLFM